MTANPNDAWDRVERLLGTDALQRLSTMTVGVVGLGSGGGFVAQSLAMSGVGKFILVDDDTLEETNVVRHVADRRYLGRGKAEVVAELLAERNPDVQVEVRNGRIEQHMDVLDDCDLLVVGVDGEGTKYAINEACLERDLPAVYAGVYERGEGGDVTLIRPYDGPCYACWASELREGLFEADPGDADEDLDYGMIGRDGTLKAEPGLWLNVVKVASVQADMALNELLTGTHIHQEYPGNTIILANRAMEIIEGEVTPPHTGVWVTISRDPNCMVCGDQLRSEDGAAGEISLDDLAGSSGIISKGDDR